MRCLGLDLGTQVSGAALVEGDSQQSQLIQEVTLKAPAGRLSARLDWMTQEIQTFIHKTRPDTAALETPFYGRNVKSLSSLAQIRGAVLVVLERAGIPVIDLAPQSIKKTVTGYGSASKEQVSQMLQQIFGVTGFSSQDASDAAAAGYAGLLTALHQEKMRGVLSTADKETT